jgi:predicted dinucleotide-binding enzyme
MNVGVIGTGDVGDALANGFLALGHAVVRGTRDPAKLSAWAKTAGAQASVETMEGAAREAELVVLAVKGTAAEQVVHACAAGLVGKTVIDTTNPIDDVAPEGGC